MNYVQIAKAAKKAALACIAAERRVDPDCYYTHREIEILALDADGERCGLGEALYLSMKECSGKNIREAIESVIRLEDDAVSIGVGGGVDCYSSMSDMMNGYDYDPYTGAWDLENIAINDDR